MQLRKNLQNWERERNEISSGDNTQTQTSNRQPKR